MYHKTKLITQIIKDKAGDRFAIYILFCKCAFIKVHLHKKNGLIIIFDIPIYLISEYEMTIYCAFYSIIKIDIFICMLIFNYRKKTSFVAEGN